MAEEAQDRAPAALRSAIPRLATGLAQGLVAWGLTEAAKHTLWPATQPALFAALSLILAFVPLILIGGYGRIRALPLAIWALAAAAALAIFAWHDIDAAVWTGLGESGAPPRLVTASQVFAFTAVFVFVGHHLVGPADEARKLLAPYATYFDWAWKDAVQLALSAAFVGVLWASLWLGASLFKLIGVDALQQLIEKPWFGLPVTGFAFAAAVQLTDVRVALIRGVRMVGLVLLSWLLPVMTLIAVGFVAALPFTGLTKLFGAASAGATMLSACAVLIILVSAAYQDGTARAHAALRWSARASGLALVPLTLIAGDAIAIRVGEYGLTPARIEAIACAIIGAGFAVGYAIAAVRRGDAWMKPLELTNVVMARVAMLAILVLFTPIADPARLSVGDQTARLLAGKTPLAKFDFEFLRFRAGRYGLDALKRLAALKGDPNKLAIAAKAADAEKAEYAGEIGAQQSFAQRIIAYPAGTQIPKSFVDRDWSKAGSDAPACYFNAGQCEAYLLDVDGDGKSEVLIGQHYADQTILNLEIFKETPGGGWTQVGQVNVTCAAAVAAMRAGKVEVAPAAGRDLVAGGRREPIEHPEPPCEAPSGK